jgi:hypothetical protein
MFDERVVVDGCSDIKNALGAVRFCARFVYCFGFRLSFEQQLQLLVNTYQEK